MLESRMLLSGVDINLGTVGPNDIIENKFGYVTTGSDGYDLYRFTIDEGYQVPDTSENLISLSRTGSGNILFSLYGPSGFESITSQTNSYALVNMNLPALAAGDYAIGVFAINDGGYSLNINLNPLPVIVPAPEVSVFGSGNSILDGDTSPRSIDGTDFGSVLQNGSTVSRTFTVRNDGNATLTLGGLTAPSGFSITEGLSSSLAAGASDTFTVRMSTTTVGTKSGDIRFTTNDSNEGFYNFRITGTVTALQNPAPNRVDIAPSSLGYGIPAQDNAAGNGFILYSQQSVQQRFAGAIIANGAEHFVAVRYISNQWQYAHNDVWVNFTPTTGDRLIAAINFDISQVQMLLGSSGSVNGINQGYVESDLMITANQWRNRYNEGEFGITGTYFTLEQATPQTTQVDIAPSSLGYGIPGQDNATGDGFILYSQQSVQQRFAGAIIANGAEHFVAVRYISNQWQYAHNDVWVNFTPTTGDRLIAAINFDISQVQMLLGSSGSVNGINQGYVESDLMITANQWRNRYNEGEFGIMGTYFTLEQAQPQTTRIDITPSSLGYGIPGQDYATGNGFILYSQQSVQQRFAGAIIANGAEHFVAVRYISNQWQYAHNDVWVNFTPTTGDRLIAAINFDISQVQMLLGSSGSVNGINQGYVESDLMITANQWRNRYNEGEFGITGTYFTLEQATNGRPSDPNGGNNTSGQALNLGTAGAASLSVSRTDLIGVSQDTIDYYRFSVASGYESEFRIVYEASQGNLANLNFVLEDASGNSISIVESGVSSSTTKIFTLPTLSSRLDEGTYYLKFTSSAAANLEYNFTLFATTN
ncbi:choice-of-anchor D domain-containing protein [uncultured Rubinisphaera sp.]|uniref:choice-of-anchor D domain-containing protein n=1 Tax=uncultured Rubinisphaera sp. TaxID=1678686 RepID=UPI0030DCEF8C